MAAQILIEAILPLVLFCGAALLALTWVIHRPKKPPKTLTDDEKRRLKQLMEPWKK